MPPPKHIRQIQAQRRARAPYNFVPLPELIVPAQELPAQDTYHADRYTGRIVCTLTSASPLYVRAPMTAAEDAQYGRESYHDLPPEVQSRRAAFFHRGDARPVIPGSSLRGMLRNLVEIAAYSKIERVIDRRLFYRAISEPHYRNQFMRSSGGVFRSQIRTGFVRLQDQRKVIAECEHGRLAHTEIERLFGPPHKEGFPNRDVQHARLFVALDAGKGPSHGGVPPTRTVSVAATQSFTGAREATLVITGPMSSKRREYVFLHGKPLAEYPIPEELVERFDSGEQRTAWQEEAFPAADQQGRKGTLRIDDPVFFLLNPDGSVKFFGRAQRFRLPYRYTPREEVLPELRSEQVDIAEAIFGMVRGERQAEGAQTIAGRVSVSDAVCITPGNDLWLADGTLTPKILATPKPTTYQHYLVQTTDVQRNLANYNSVPEATTIRGHKLYWHKGAVGSADIRADPEAVKKAKTQHTGIRPVRAGVSFCCEVHFENLSAVEIGALLWVLQLGDNPQYRLKLGMGRPLGMGAVAVQSRVIVIDAAQRYNELFDGHGQPVTGERELTDVEQGEKVSAFGEYVLAQLGVHAAGCRWLRDTTRMQSLMAMLSWPGPLPAETRYLEIAHPQNGNEYKYRPVLPHPADVRLQAPLPAPQLPTPLTERPLSISARPAAAPTPTPAARPAAAPVPAPAAQPAAAALPTPQDARERGLRLNGSCTERVAQVTLNGRALKKVIRIQLDRGQLLLGDGVTMHCYVVGQRNGRFSGVIQDIDDSNPNRLLILLSAG